LSIVQNEKGLLKKRAFFVLYKYFRDYLLQKHPYNPVAKPRHGSIYEGTSEVQRVVISRDVLKD